MCLCKPCNTGSVTANVERSLSERSDRQLCVCVCVCVWESKSEYVWAMERICVTKEGGRENVWVRMPLCVLQGHQLSEWDHVCVCVCHSRLADGTCHRIRVKSHHVYPGGFAGRICFDEIERQKEIALLLTPHTHLRSNTL